MTFLTLAQVPAHTHIRAHICTHMRTHVHTTHAYKHARTHTTPYTPLLTMAHAAHHAWTCIACTRANTEQQRKYDFTEQFLFWPNLG